MNIDEEVLVQEVRRKRRDAVYSVSEREVLRRQERVAPTTVRPAQPADGPAVSERAGTAELEKELVTYLLRYGCKEVEFTQEESRYTMTVAQPVIGELRPDGLEFGDPVYGTIYKEYLSVYDVNPNLTAESFPMSRFTDHPDPKVCNAVVDILMKSESLTPSKIWEKNEIVVENEEDRLYYAVPRAVSLYKLKMLGLMKEELISQLSGTEMDDRAEEILRKISRINEISVRISTRLSRIIP